MGKLLALFCLFFHQNHGLPGTSSIRILPASRVLQRFARGSPYFGGVKNCIFSMGIYIANVFAIEQNI